VAIQVCIFQVRHNNDIISANTLKNVKCISTYNCVFYYIIVVSDLKYEGWNFNSGNYLFTTDTK